MKRGKISLLEHGGALALNSKTIHEKLHLSFYPEEEMAFGYAT